MELSPTVITNPGVFEYDDKRRKALSKYKSAVNKSKFLNKEQKRNWKLLGYHLSTTDLQQAEKEIIKESLKQLKIAHKLEKLKQKER